MTDSGNEKAEAAEARSGGSRRRMRAVLCWMTPLGNLTAFVAALFLTGAFLRRTVPEPPIAQITDKLALWRQGGGRYDAVFFGSSKIYSGILPQLFDEQVRACGGRTSSFNLGVDGMTSPELQRFCDVALSQPGVKPRWVFVEVVPVRTRIPPSHRGTRRILYWHDLPATALVFSQLLRGLDQGLPLTHPDAAIGQAAPWRLACDHGALFVQRSLALGDGAASLQDFLRPAASRKPLGVARVDPRDVVSEETRGYRPIPGQLKDAALEQYRTGLETFADPPPEGDPVTVQAYARLARRIAKAGAVPVFVIFPNPRGNRLVFRSPTRVGPAEIWAFDSPSQYPALYRPEFRADAVHLNESGAREFTAALAERFVKAFGVRPPAPEGTNGPVVKGEP